MVSFIHPLLVRTWTLRKTKEFGQSAEVRLPILSLSFVHVYERSFVGCATCDQADAEVYHCFVRSLLNVGRPCLETRHSRTEVLVHIFRINLYAKFASREVSPRTVGSRV